MITSAGSECPQTSVVVVATVKGYRFGLRGRNTVWRLVRTPAAPDDEVRWEPFLWPGVPRVIELGKADAVELARGILLRIRKGIHTNPSLSRERVGCEGPVVVPDDFGTTRMAFGRSHSGRKIHG